MGKDRQICTRSGCITIRGSKKRQAGGGRRSKQPRLCTVLLRDVAAGKKSFVEAKAIVESKTRWSWEAYCRDPGYKKLGAASKAAKGPKSVAKTATPLIDAAYKKWKKEQEAARKQLVGKFTKLMQSQPSKAWALVKDAAKKAYELLEAARKTQETETHLKVWTNSTMSRLHDMIAAADKWKGRAETAVAVYEMFDSFRAVKPSWAKTDPKRYALAMGNLLAKAGQAMKKLPAPFNVYGDFLSRAGTFFDDVRHGLDPSLRWRKRQGRYAKEGHPRVLP